MSIETRNFSPFPNMHFANLDAKGREFGIFMLKVAWDIGEDERCTLSGEQEPFALTDGYHGALNVSALRYPSDFVPYKPKTDILLNATGFVLGGEPAPRWTVGVALHETGQKTSLLDKRLTVCGPRLWQYRHNAWILSDPEPSERLDIRYEHAFGGTIVKGEDDTGAPVEEAYEFNPVGCGLIDTDWTPTDAPQAAPAIETLDEPLTDPGARPTPAGFGPIPPAWLPRRPLGGTYDQRWMETVWPRWAEDYDFAFHNSAPKDQQIHLTDGTGLTFDLTNLHPTRPEWRIDLPPFQPVVSRITDAGRVLHYAPKRDTVFLDIAQSELADPRLYEMYRLVFDLRDTALLALSVRPEGDETPILASPHPHDVAAFPAQDDEDEETAA